MKLLPPSSVARAAQSHLLPAYKDFPNSSLHNLPLIIYRPFDMEDGGRLNPNDVETLLKRNGLTPAWRYGMFPFNHYHSNTHEVLVPFSGTATLAFGHDSSPSFIKHSARAGDVYILPAGTAHRALDSSPDFTMVGSYPAGSKNWDNCRGDVPKEETKRLWKEVEVLGGKKLAKDPIYGDDPESPLAQLWR